MGMVPAQSFGPDWLRVEAVLLKMQKPRSASAASKAQATQPRASLQDQQQSCQLATGKSNHSLVDPPKANPLVAVSHSGQYLQTHQHIVGML